MIKAIRVTLSGNVPYEGVKIYPYDSEGPSDLINIFEDSQLAFECKDGKFVLPDYQVIVAQLRKGRVPVPSGSFKVIRIRLHDDISYNDCSIVPKEQWTKLGVPQLFRDFEQLVFICKEGLFVTSDFNVRDIRYK